MSEISLLCEAKNFTLAHDGTASTIHHNRISGRRLENVSPLRDGQRGIAS
jgi:hypothetical protein